MTLTYHHPGAEDISRTPAHALLRGAALQAMRLRQASRQRLRLERWCDRMHERLTVEGVPHVCQVNARTEMLQQIWVMDPKAVLMKEAPS